MIKGKPQRLANLASVSFDRVELSHFITPA